MAQGRKGRLNYRGLRCSFVGDEKEIQRLNAQLRHPHGAKCNMVIFNITRLLYDIFLYHGVDNARYIGHPLFISGHQAI